MKDTNITGHDPTKHRCIADHIILITWAVVIMVFGIPFNVFAAVILSASTKLKTKFVAIYLSIITFLNIILALNLLVLILFVHDQFKKHPEGDWFFYYKLWNAVFWINTGSIRWIYVTMDVTRFAHIVGYNIVKSRWKIVLISTVVVALSSIYQVFAIDPFIGIERTSNDHLGFGHTSLAGRLHITITFIVIPTVISILSNATILCRFRYRTPIKHKVLRRQILNKMRNVVVIEILEFIFLLCPFISYFVLLPEKLLSNLHNRCYGHILTVSLLCLYYSGMLVSILKYCILWEQLNTTMKQELKRRCNTACCCWRAMPWQTETMRHQICLNTPFENRGVPMPRRRVTMSILKYNAYLDIFAPDSMQELSVTWAGPLTKASILNCTRMVRMKKNTLANIEQHQNTESTIM